MRVWFLLVFFAFFASGCSEPESMEYLIRVGEAGVTVPDYQRELEVAKTAYTHNAVVDPELVRTMRTRVLNQMADEMILLQVAEEKGLAVSAAELESAAERIKKDYPEGVFEELLLENAVSSGQWLIGLKKRLLMERVVDETLCRTILVSPEEAAEYYRAFSGGTEPVSLEKADSREVGGEIIKQLKRKKAEKLYGAWMAELRKRYRVEINRQLWNRVQGK